MIQSQPLIYLQVLVMNRIESKASYSILFDMNDGVSYFPPVTFISPTMTSYTNPAHSALGFASEADRPLKSSLFLVFQQPYVGNANVLRSFTVVTLIPPREKHWEINSLYSFVSGD